MDDLAALIDLNRDYITSVQTSDVRRFDEILADDFLCSNPDGSLVDRAGFLKQTAVPVKISGLQAHEVNVRLMGDFAIIHAKTTYTGPDGRPGSGRYTVVWARRHRRWLAVSAHGTRCRAGDERRLPAPLGDLRASLPTVGGTRRRPRAGSARRTTG